MSELTEENCSTDLSEKYRLLEEKNNKMQSEFNQQRGKLRDLFLQKESDNAKCLEEKNRLQKELDDLKSQLYVTECKTENQIQIMDRRAQEEISSLQQLVQETIEESSVCKSELDKFQEENTRLKYEINQLREELQDNSGFTPVLSHVKKFAKKLGTESNSSVENTTIVEATGKVSKYAQEDAEVLRSLVVPLEEEIKALKKKLRSADEELQVFKQPVDMQLIPIETLDGPLVNQSTSMEFQCQNCRNFENRMEESANLLKKEIEKSERLEKSIQHWKEDLHKEANLRTELEQQWQEEREKHKECVEKLRYQLKISEDSHNAFVKQFTETKEEINKKLLKLISNRETVNKHLETLQSDNDYLSGKYLATSEELELQLINLPQNVEELHELLLQQQNDLIQSRVGCEFEKRKCVAYLDEAQVLRDQLDQVIEEKTKLEHKYQQSKKNFQDHLMSTKLKEQTSEANKEAQDRTESELNKQISEMRVHIIELKDINEKLKEVNLGYKQKMKNLQEDLSTSEHVQKDFVKLSQLLQIKLEKFRTEDKEVRWKDDEDVENCPNCNVCFTVTIRKQHCRHCGDIFCEKCLCKSVPSGPRRKLVRVCDMCHTLLTPNTAPYFSQDLPHSPT